MINKLFASVLILTALLFQACSGNSGGVEIGNPPTARSVIGSVDASSVSALSKTLTKTSNCIADTLIATDSSAVTTTAATEDDCSFDMSLTVGKAYVLSLTKDGEFISTVFFTNTNSSLTDMSFLVSSGDTDIDLGLISLNGSNAFAANHPGRQNDADDDGIDDFDDTDDDGDGISDDDEEDCDLDGFWDDFDDEDVCEDDVSSGGDEGEAVVLEVTPRSGETGVNLDRQIEIRFGCEIDEDSAFDALFIVEDAEGVEIDCDYQFEDDRINCEPFENFESQTTYTVTVSGVFCFSSEEEVPETSWSFTTR